MVNLYINMSVTTKVQIDSFGTFQRVLELRKRFERKATLAMDPDLRDTVWI